MSQGFVFALVFVAGRVSIIGVTCIGLYYKQTGTNVIPYRVCRCHQRCLLPRLRIWRSEELVATIPDSSLPEGSKVANIVECRVSTFGIDIMISGSMPHNST